MEAIRAEIQVIEGTEEATEDELQRAQGLLDEWDGKKTDYDAALAREAKVDEVLRAKLDQRKVEPQSPAAQRGPEVMRRVEPFETQEELVRPPGWCAGASRSRPRKSWCGPCGAAGPSMRRTPSAVPWPPSSAPPGTSTTPPGSAWTPCSTWTTGTPR